MAIKKKAQVSMDDKIVSNSEVLALLEEREHMKAGVKAYQDKDKAAKTAIGMLEEEPPYRIGRFFIERKTRPGRSVQFEVESSTRLVITTADK